LNCNPEGIVRVGGIPEVSDPANATNVPYGQPRWNTERSWPESASGRARRSYPRDPEPSSASSFGGSEPEVGVRLSGSKVRFSFPPIESPGGQPLVEIGKAPVRSPPMPIAVRPPGGPNPCGYPKGPRCGAGSCGLGTVARETSIPNQAHINHQSGQLLSRVVRLLQKVRLTDLPGHKKIPCGQRVRLYP